MSLKYPLDKPMLGIDISKYQGTVDFDQVKASGYSFVFVRIGWANFDGTLSIDPYFDRNILGATNAGLPVGVYLYSYLESEDAAKIAAGKVLEVIDEYTITMPVVLDFEHGSLYRKYSRDTNTAICNSFLKVIRNAGYLPMYYSYTSFVNSYMNMATLEKDEGLWIANYTGKIGVDDVAIWQYTSSGRVPGIPGRVDLNRMYFDIPRIVRESYSPKDGVDFDPIHNKALDVFTENKCEYFSAPSINATVDRGDGITDKLPIGTYPAVSISDKLVDGYSMVQVDYNGSLVYVALLDDRCRLVKSEEPNDNKLSIAIRPMPNDGDRAIIESYLNSLGFEMEINW